MPHKARSLPAGVHTFVKPFEHEYLYMSGQWPGVESVTLGASRYGDHGPEASMRVPRGAKTLLVV